MTLQFPLIRLELPNGLLVGSDRRRAFDNIITSHYTHSVPAGKTYCFQFGDATVLWSIPANMNIARFLLGKNLPVWELSRLWAPDGHAPNLLTTAISVTLRAFREQEPSCVAVVSYADPNVGHEGFVYRAASWNFCGQCEESRYYRDESGQSVSRRKFHSGGGSGLTKAQIEAMGFREENRPGKLRFALELRGWARSELQRRFP
jgi:hypothetical protein